jgi:hypothetical protein
MRARAKKEFVSFDLTRGETILVAIIFAMIYSSGFLPKIAKALAGEEGAAKGE